MDFKHIFVALVLQIVLMCSLSAAVTQTQLEDFTTAVKKISSSDLYQNSGSTSKNIVISPYSIANAIVLLAQAGSESALDQLKSSISFNGSNSDLLDEYVAYHESLKNSAEQLTMLVANKLYVQEGHSVNPKFTEVATQQLQSGVRMIDFRNTTESAKIINGFVQEKTQNKTGDIINPLKWYKIILTNTIYMKFTFDKVHQAIAVNVSDSFYTHNPNPNAVQKYDNITYVVFENGRFNYAELNDSLKAQALEIRFADSKFSLLLILPSDQNSISNLERDMNNYNLTQILNQMRPSTVTVKLPLFRSEYKTSIDSYSAQSIKISNFFGNEPNLTGLFSNDTKTPFSDIFLTTVFELEAGKKPNEKTNNFLLSLSKLYTSDQNYSFVANRPFLYHVWDHELKTSVVSGRYSEIERKVPN